MLSLPNEVAAELATIGDGMLDALRHRLGVSLHLRGTRLTLEGSEEEIASARVVLDELIELVDAGHAIGPGTIDAVLGALDANTDVREVLEDVVWRHRGKRIAPKTVNQKRYVDAIRRDGEFDLRARKVPDAERSVGAHRTEFGRDVVEMRAVLRRVDICCLDVYRFSQRGRVQASFAQRTLRVDGGVLH